jgi:hypothetical protein
VTRNLAEGPWTTGSVALVGNASSVQDSSFGPLIDGHECVVRINQGAFIPLRAGSTGLRTDVLFMTLPGYAWDKAWMYARGRLKASTVVAMSPKDRTFLGIDMARLIPVYPTTWHQELSETLGGRPSTGAMAVDLLSRTVADISAVHLFGFDFWSTPTHYTGISKPSPHDPQAEESWVRSVLPESNIHTTPEDSDGRS